MLRTELPPSPGIHISHLLVPASILCWPAQNFHTWMREWTINYSCEKLTNVCFPPREPSAVPPSTDSFQRTCLPKTPLRRFSKGCCKRRARSSRWQFHSDQQLRPSSCYISTDSPHSITSHDEDAAAMDVLLHTLYGQTKPLLSVRFGSQWNEISRTYFLLVTTNLVNWGNE